MKQLWNITIDDYLAVCEIAKKAGVKPGESMEKYFHQYMKDKNIKPAGCTELSKEELIKEYKSHGKKVLDITEQNKEVSED